MRFVDPTVPELDHVNWRFGRGLIPDGTGVSSFAIGVAYADKRWAPLRDNFDRADAASIGPPWIAVNNPLPSLSGNAAFNPSGYREAYWPTIFAGQVEVYLTYSQITTIPQAGIDVQLHFNPDSVAHPPYGLGYDLYMSTDIGGGQVGAVSQVLDPSGVTALETFLFTPQAGDAFCYRSEADRIRVWRKPVGGVWSPMSAGAVNAASRSGYIGLNIDDAGGKIEDFGGGTYPPSKPQSVAFGPLQQELDVAAAAASWPASSIASGNPYLKSALRQLGFAETVLS